MDNGVIYGVADHLDDAPRQISQDQLIQEDIVKISYYYLSLPQKRLQRIVLSDNENA